MTREEEMPIRGGNVVEAVPRPGQQPLAVSHGSYAFCAWCGGKFEPRIRNGPNADRFCQPSHKDAYWNQRRKTNPPAVGADAAGDEIQQSTDAPDHTASAFVRKPTKIKRILGALACGQSLTRFEAEFLGDHCLNSTIAKIEHHYRLTVARRSEMVPGFAGHPTRCCRYWLEPEQREEALKALEMAP